MFTSDGDDIFPIHGARMTPLNGRGGDRAFPTEKRMRPSPEWNHHRIECVDGAISPAVNGKIVTRGTNASAQGYICLESEGSPADFPQSPDPGTAGHNRPSTRPTLVRLTRVSAPVQWSRPHGMAWRPGCPKHWKAEDWTLTHDGAQGEGDPHLWSDEELGTSSWSPTGDGRRSQWTVNFPVILPQRNPGA